MIEVVNEPSLFFQYFKGLFIGLLFGWFIASYLYYKQYNNLLTAIYEGEGGDEL